MDEATGAEVGATTVAVASPAGAAVGDAARGPGAVGLDLGWEGRVALAEGFAVDRGTVHPTKPSRISDETKERMPEGRMAISFP